MSSWSTNNDPSSFISNDSWSNQSFTNSFQSSTHYSEPISYQNHIYSSTCCLRLTWFCKKNTLAVGLLSGIIVGTIIVVSIAMYNRALRPPIPTPFPGPPDPPIPIPPTPEYSTISANYTCYGTITDTWDCVDDQNPINGSKADTICVRHNCFKFRFFESEVFKGNLSPKRTLVEPYFEKSLRTFQKQCSLISKTWIFS